jgi:hypothetical protein
VEGTAVSLIYRRMALRSWEQGVFPRLSPLQPSGQALALVLSLSPLSIILPGVANAGRGAILDLLPSWSSTELDASLADLEAHGAFIDLRARVIFLPWVLDEAMPESPNVVKAWRRRFEELPGSEVTSAIHQHVGRFLIAYGQAGKARKETRPSSWIEAWDPTFTEASTGPSAALSGSIAEGSEHHSPKPRGSVVTPFSESGIRDQEAGIRGQGSGDGSQITGNSKQESESRRGKGKSHERGKPSSIHECTCGRLICLSASGERTNHDDGRPHVHERSAVGASYLS